MDIKVGDEVRVFDVNRRKVGQVDVGRPGIVVKVGRKLVHIKCGSLVDTFRLDTGRANDNYGHQSFKVLAEAEADLRRDTALQELRDRRVSLNPGHGFTVDQIVKLADLVRSFTGKT